MCTLCPLSSHPCPPSSHFTPPRPTSLFPHSYVDIIIGQLSSFTTTFTSYTSKPAPSTSTLIAGYPSTARVDLHSRPTRLATTQQATCRELHDAVWLLCAQYVDPEVCEGVGGWMGECIAECCPYA